MLERYRALEAQGQVAPGTSDKVAQAINAQISPAGAIVPSEGRPDAGLGGVAPVGTKLAAGTPATPTVEPPPAPPPPEPGALPPGETRLGSIDIEAKPKGEEERKYDPTEMVTVGSATRYTSPLYGKKEGTEALGALQEAYRSSLSAGKGQAEIRQQQATLLKKSVVDAKTYLTGVKGKRDETYTQLKGAEDNYRRLLAEQGRAKIDPDRMMQQMPDSRKAMLYVASALGGFVEGLTEGRVKNRVIGMMDKAIDRDVAAQRANMQKILQSVQLAGVERSRLTSLLTGYEDRVRNNMRNLVALQFQGLGIQAKTLQAKAALSDLGARYALHKVGVAAKMRPQISTVTKRAARGALMAGAKGKVANLPAPDLRALRESAESGMIFGRLYRDIKKLGGISASTILGSVLPWTNSAITTGVTKAMALKLAAAYNQGRPTEPDRKAVAGLVMDARKDTVGSALKKLRGVQRMMRYKTRSYLLTYMPDRYDIRPVQRVHKSIGIETPTVGGLGKVQ
jgi:hypothetical protein